MIGRIREAACTRLGEQAFEAAHRAGYFTTPTIKNAEALETLRDALACAFAAWRPL